MRGKTQGEKKERIPAMKDIETERSDTRSLSIKDFSNA